MKGMKQNDQLCSSLPLCRKTSDKYRIVQAWKSLMVWALIDATNLHPAASFTQAGAPALLLFRMDLERWMTSAFSYLLSSGDRMWIFFLSSAKWDLTTAKCRRSLLTSFLIFRKRSTTVLHGPHQAWYASTTASMKIRTRSEWVISDLHQ